MTALPIVLHLVDDTTAGGVMRVVDFIRTSPEMAKLAVHRVRHVKRGQVNTQRLDADMIVSHLAISWRNLPTIIAIRAAHATRQFLHVEHSYTETFVALNVRNRRRFSTLLKVSYALFNRVIAVSNGQFQWISTRGLCQPHKLMTIQSCVDLAPFRSLSAPAGPARIFGAIGRLDRQKGFDTLIAAFRACTNPDIRLHIFGEGDEEQALRALAGADDRIIFKGFTPDPVAAFAQVDAIVMPSRWEAYGLVGIEALSAGRALVCSDLDGMADHRSGGAVLVRPGSVSDLKAQIIALSSPGREAAQASPYRAGDVLEYRFVSGWAQILKDVCVSGRKAGEQGADQRMPNFCRE